MNQKGKIGVIAVLSMIIVASIVITSFLQTPLSREEVLGTLDDNIMDTMSDRHVPGVAACAVKNGEVIWMKTYGYADLELNLPVTNDTLFMLGSVSKITTGVAFMQLVEDGLIDLDDDINEYLPFDVVHPDYQESIITPRMLLSHVSGIHDNWAILGPLESTGDTPISLENLTMEYLLTNGTYYQPANYAAEPGQEFDYTNVGSTLIAYLLEVVSGDSFEDYCQQNIFTPLGMDTTSWFLSNLDIASIAIPYLHTGSAHTPRDHYGSPVYPCGFLRTSISQQATFMTMLMEGGAVGDTRILDNSTLQMMMTHHYPELAPTYGFFFQHSGVLWGHGGSGPGVATRTYFYPEVHEGVIIMMNLEDSTALNIIHNHILNGMRDAYGWSS
jgi:CubicO group peptidase (beta-lactamase class C family)